MNSSDNHRSDEAGRLVSRWLDDDWAQLPTSETGSVGVRPAEPVDPGNFDPATRRRAAELQLVHALLQGLYEQDTALREARVQSVMARIGQPVAEPGISNQPAIRTLTVGARHPAALLHISRSRLVRWASAACLLLVVGLLIWRLSPPPVLAALERVVAEMAKPVDRTYMIRVSSDEDRRHGGRRNAGPDAMLGDGERLDRASDESRRNPISLDEAVLYLRSTDQFVLYRRAKDGRLVVSGSNGRESWLVHPKGPVLVSDDPHAFRIPLPQDVAQIPFVDIKATLLRLREGYRIEPLPDEPLDSDPTTLWKRLRAEKIRPSQKGPKWITIWYHPQTYVLGRLVLERLHMQGRPELKRLAITLIDESPLRADWFEHTAHHATGRPVIPAEK